MKNMNEIFSKSEIMYMVHCSMRGGFSCCLEEVTMETMNIDEIKKKTEYELNMFLDEKSYQILVVPIYEANCCEHELELIICSDGNVYIRNLFGTRYSLADPISVYELMIKKKKYLKELEEHFWEELVK